MSIMVMLCGMVMLPARWQNSIRNDVAMELAFHNALLSAHVPAAELRRQLAAVERATQAHDQVLVAHLGHLGVVPVDRPAICFGSFSCAALARPGEGGGGGGGGGSVAWRPRRCKADTVSMPLPSVHAHSAAWGAVQEGHSGSL